MKTQEEIEQLAESKFNVAYHPYSKRGFIELDRADKYGTLIVKQNGNESIKANLRFRLLMNGTRYDMFIHETYNEAKSRLATLKRIFKYSTHEIIVIE